MSNNENGNHDKNFGVKAGQLRACVDIDGEFDMSTAVIILDVRDVNRRVDPRFVLDERECTYVYVSRGTYYFCKQFDAYVSNMARWSNVLA